MCRKTWKYCKDPPGEGKGRSKKAGAAENSYMHARRVCEVLRRRAAGGGGQSIHYNRDEPLEDIIRSRSYFARDLPAITLDIYVLVYSSSRVLWRRRTRPSEKAARRISRSLTTCSLKRPDAFAIERNKAQKNGKDARGFPYALIFSLFSPSCSFSLFLGSSQAYKFL